MFLDGYIGAPPTITVISAKLGAAKLAAPEATTAASRPAHREFLRFMNRAPWVAARSPMRGCSRYASLAARFQSRQEFSPRSKSRLGVTFRFGARRSIGG